ncbi:MAG: sigma-54-dependent Fis family transcriptional regulator [Gammaproteobacteria bacterium]|nr:sigma-54-dependent Fis family transcriptional regulator [Gammaproteobacteria bacterium]
MQPAATQGFTKSVLLLSERTDDMLVQMLAAGFWRSVLLRPGLATARRAGAALPHIGLICLRHTRAADIDALEQTLTALGEVDWIGIVTPESAALQCVREFIAQHCISYQTAPLDRERLLYALGHAAGMRSLLGSARGEARLAEGHFLILGDSPVMQRLRRDLLKIAAVDAPVLLTGETGAGKELAAQTIHEQSRRGDAPFIAINCAALSPSLIHAELFGAEKGAFTGAYARRVGQLEAAHRGTVFLDEIGDLHAEMQVLLLRFLEEKLVRRLGSRDAITVDARVIAATNVDLEQAVKQGRFREDLYHRLNVLRVHLPPLRERREDIGPLASAFLTRLSAEHARRVDGFSRAALGALQRHVWPGNVRELLNRIRRAVILGEGRMISADDLQLTSAPEEATGMPTLGQARATAEQEALQRGLATAAGDGQRAAQLLGISRATFYRLLQKYGLAGPGAARPPLDAGRTVAHPASGHD